MESIDTEILLKFLMGSLSVSKRQNVEKFIAEHPYYIDNLKGLSIMLDELGSVKKVLHFLEKKKKRNPFKSSC